MTYGQMKTMVLQLLDRYSVGSEEVPLTYNGQGDLVARIPALTRDCLYYMATSVRRLRTVTELRDPEIFGTMQIYALPDDYYQAVGAPVRMTDGKICRSYRVTGDRMMLIPEEERGPFMLEYFRYPCVPQELPEDDDFLDCPPEAWAAVAYYVAAHLVMEDDRYLHAALYNEFEMKMARLQEGVRLEPGLTADVYGGE